MKVEVMIDNVSYNQKPNKVEVGAVVNRLGDKETIKNITTETLSRKLTEGFSVKPSICGTKEKAWTSQQLFFVDIDEGLTLENIIDKLAELSKNGIGANFIYTTFNHSEKNNKFRIVFTLKTPTFDKEAALSLQNILNRLFLGDERCSNLNRIFYGGKKVVYVNFDTVIDINHIVNEFSNLFDKDKKENLFDQEKTKSAEKSKNTAVEKAKGFSNNRFCSYQLVEYFKRKDVEKLREIFGSEEIILFETNQEFFDYIFKINLFEVLGLEAVEGQSFHCVFHDDKNPSASIFIDKETRNYIYKCNSKSCGASYNLLGIIEVLGKFTSRPKAYDFIKEIFCLEIRDTKWQQEQKAILIENLKFLHSPEFNTVCSKASKNIASGLRHLEALHLIALDHIHDENLIDEHGNITFFASAKQIAERIEGYKDMKGLGKYVSALAYHKFTDKLSDDEIDESYLKKTKHISAKHGLQKRVTWFSLGSYTTLKLREIEKQAQLWQENSYSVRNISREALFRSEGLDVANRVYPQYEKISKKENGKTIVDDRTTTEESDRISNFIAIKLLKNIEANGYMRLSDLTKEIGDEHGKYIGEYKVKTCLKEIMDTYDLKKIRLNKSLKKKFNITTIGYPFILTKSEPPKKTKEN